MIVTFFVEGATQEDFRTQNKTGVYPELTGARLNCIVIAVLDVRKKTAGTLQGCYKRVAMVLLTF